MTRPSSHRRDDGNPDYDDELPAKRPRLDNGDGSGFVDPTSQPSLSAARDVPPNIFETGNANAIRAYIAEQKQHYDTLYTQHRPHVPHGTVEKYTDAVARESESRHQAIRDLVSGSRYHEKADKLYNRADWNEEHARGIEQNANTLKTTAYQQADQARNQARTQADQDCDQAYAQADQDCEQAYTQAGNAQNDAYMQADQARDQARTQADQARDQAYTQADQARNQTYAQANQARTQADQDWHQACTQADDARDQVYAQADEARDQAYTQAEVQADHSVQQVPVFDRERDRFEHRAAELDERFDEGQKAYEFHLGQAKQAETQIAGLEQQYPEASSAGGKSRAWALLSRELDTTGAPSKYAVPARDDGNQLVYDFASLDVSMDELGNIRSKLNNAIELARNAISQLSEAQGKTTEGSQTRYQEIINTNRLLIDGIDRALLALQNNTEEMNSRQQHEAAQYAQ